MIWRACATNSLPVPVSPRTNTVLSEGATFSIKNLSSKTFLLSPI